MKTYENFITDLFKIKTLPIELVNLGDALYKFIRNNVTTLINYL